MRIQNLAIIFIIIILPISLVIATYSQYQVKTINTQTVYDNKLTSATYDAIRAFQINTINSTTSDLTNSKLRDLEASISTFRSSIKSAFSLEGYSEDELDRYIPALVYTLYDGFYIYSPYTNENYQYNEDGTSKDNNGEKQYGLKPYISYSCKYKTGNIDVVITYALDNHITVRGIINNEYVNKDGYLIDGITCDTSIPAANADVYYNGVQIENEQLKEYLPNDSGIAYPYAKINGTKYYKIGTGSSAQIVYVSNGTLMVQCKAGDNLFDTYNKIIEKNYMAKEYYYKSYEFTEWFKSTGLRDLKYSDAYDEILVTDEQNTTTEYKKIWENNNDKIFKFKDSTGTNIENESSTFNQHRLEVIKHKITTNLSVAIANYNAYLNVNNVFQMPEIQEDEWDQIIHNISLISFLQGISIGGKVYNGYTIVTNSESEEVVLEKNIYMLGSDNYYHRIGDKLLENSGGVKLDAGKYGKDSSSAGRLNLDFIRKFATNNNNATYYYYPLRDYNASYNSVIMQDKVTTYDDIYIYISQQSDEYKKAFYTALGRERGSFSFALRVLDTNHIQIIAKDGEEKQEYYPTIGTAYEDFLPEPEKKGYNFKGWYTEDGEKVNPKDTCDKDITIEAKWEKKIYTINFEANGGKVDPSSKTITYGDRYDEGGNLPIPQRDGYEFEGWYTADIGGEQKTNSSIYNIDKSSTLYAHWKNKEYIIYFDGNGGTASKNSKNVTYDETYGELPTATRAGHTFNGWYLKDSNTKINSDDVYKTAGNTTLYAHWTANKYKVSFNGNGGTPAQPSKEVTYGQTYGTLPTATRRGYKLNGWYTSASGGNKIETSTTFNNVGDVTLYAHWTRSTYTIRNLIQNGSFETGNFSNWEVVVPTNGGLVVERSPRTGSYGTRRAPSSYGQNYLKQNVSWKNGHKYYYFIYAKVPAGARGRFSCDIANHGGNGGTIDLFINNYNEHWKYAKIYSPNFTGVVPLAVNFNSTDTNIYVDDIGVVDLTDAFGTGNEPNIDWCNSNIDYFNGTKDVYYP